MRRHAGFTLIEMLIVIMVISILMGMLLPVYARVREAGRRTKCSHNLVEIGNALQLYSEDHRGWYPTTLPDDSSADLTSSVPTNQFRTAGSPAKEIGIGRLWMPYIEKQDTRKIAEIRDLVTCPSTNHWVETLQGIDLATDSDNHWCSYVYRGGGAPYSPDGGRSTDPTALRMFTADDRDTIAQRIGKFSVAVDANHERAQNHSNHDGKVNMTLYNDGSVTRVDLLKANFSSAADMMYSMDGR
jgi:prepilin-type N-terminal cleavage/methylation domain-containing protein